MPTPFLTAKYLPTWLGLVFLGGGGILIYANQKKIVRFFNSFGDQEHVYVLTNKVDGHEEPEAPQMLAVDGKTSYFCKLTAGKKEYIDHSCKLLVASNDELSVDFPNQHNEEKLITTPVDLPNVQLLKINKELYKDWIANHNDDLGVSIHRTQDQKGLFKLNFSADLMAGNLSKVKTTKFLAFSKGKNTTENLIWLDENTKYACRFTDASEHEPYFYCNIYGTPEALTNNNIKGPVTLGAIGRPTSFRVHLKNSRYYVVVLRGKPMIFDSLKNRSLEIYASKPEGGVTDPSYLTSNRVTKKSEVDQNIDSTSTTSEATPTGKTTASETQEVASVSNIKKKVLDSQLPKLSNKLDSNRWDKLITLGFDQPLYGHIAPENKTKLYPISPDKKTYIVSKETTESDTETLLTDALTVAEGNKNYRCSIPAIDKRVENNDFECTLSKLPAKPSDQTMLEIKNIDEDLTPESKQGITLKTDTDTYYKLEVDVNKLYNLTNIAENIEQKLVIKLFSNKKEDESKTYGTVIVKEDITFDEVEGLSKLIIAKVDETLDSAVFTTIKCALGDEEEFECTVKKVTTPAAVDDQIEPIKFQFATDAVTSGSKFTKNEHYLITLDKERDIAKLKNQNIVLSFVNGATVDVEEDEEDDEEKETTKVTTKQINLTITNTLLGEEGSDKQLILLN